MIICTFFEVYFSLLPSEEFTRAVYVATGIKLTQHLVNTVFKIFDEDHDDKLSHKEFIGVMKDRLHRGEGVREAKFSLLLCDTEGDKKRRTGSAHSPPPSSASESSSFGDWWGGEVCAEMMLLLALATGDETSIISLCRAAS